MIVICVFLVWVVSMPEAIEQYCYDVIPTCREVVVVKVGGRPTRQFDLLSGKVLVRDSAWHNYR